MASSKQKIQKIKGYKIFLPIALGIGVALFLFAKEYNHVFFSNLTFTTTSILFILLAFFMMILRDLGYIIRIKILSGGDFNWKNAFNVIMLWEFTSAITPSAVGGTSVAVLYVNKEGIKLGKSTAMVLATSFLDELYFVLFFPLVFLIVSPLDIFGLNSNEISFSNEYLYFALIGYGIKFLYIILVFYGLFINPLILKQILTSIFKLRFLKKWREKAENVGNDIVSSSQILKKKSFLFWFWSFLASILSWTARYLVINFLLLALYTVISSEKTLTLYDHILLYARQLSMWIMLLVMPSPGGSGFAEAIFSDFLKDFIPLGFISILAFSWRAITYYPYLIIGAIIFPNWLNKHFSKKGKDA